MAMKGDRAVVKHKDNLKLEGSFEGRRKSMAATKGERSVVKKHQDNLFMEGEFQGTSGFLLDCIMKMKFLIFRQKARDDGHERRQSSCQTCSRQFEA